MRTGRRDIKNGAEFNSLFPKSEGDFVEVKAFARLDDTIDLMKRVIHSTLSDTKEIAQRLRHSDPYQTCKNVWDFTFHHLQYKRDEEGKEQVRRPSRAWQDRKTGVDCDCMTVFIGSILSNLSIPFLIRLTNYPKADKGQETDEFEHVYPVALLGNQEVIMDTVVHAFNHEVPFKQKKDISMKLQYLNGIGSEDFSDDMNENIWGELLGFPLSQIGISFEEAELEGLDGKGKLKDKLKKTLNTVNKINPATTLLRAGILASMKLNIMNVAGKIRFAYMHPKLAQANKMHMAKYQQLVAIRQKLEKIFYGAGGKLENLKEAILKGKGNRDRKVTLNGLEGLDANIHDYLPLEKVLGQELMYEEFQADSLNGLGELGSISLATAIASASGVIATLQNLLKKLGDLFQKGTPQNATEIQQDKVAEKEEQNRIYSKENIEKLIKENNVDVSETLPQTLPQTPSPPTATNIPSDVVPIPPNNLDTPATAQKSEQKDPDEKKGVVAWIQENPFLTAGIAVLGVSAVALIVKASKKNKKEGLSGVKSTSKKANKKGKAKTPASPKYIRKVELL